jgi:phosphatidylethanolamine/phosphatidyl-N-methylethanolamine N-methyltransferase
MPFSTSDMPLPVASRLFLKESLRSLRSTASFVPSSRRLALALLRHIDFSRVRVMVELGSGTGAVTREILLRLRTDARLYAIDSNSAFVAHLKRNCADRRLVAIHGGAETLRAHLRSRGVAEADAVVSSLGLTTMESPRRSRIVEQAHGLLRPDGILTQYQYLVSFAGHVDLRNARVKVFDERRFLTGYFRHVASETVLLNLPPARVFTCRYAKRRQGRGA